MNDNLEPTIAELRAMFAGGAEIDDAREEMADASLTSLGQLGYLGSGEASRAIGASDNERSESVKKAHKKIYAKITKRIVDQLKTGEAPWVRPWGFTKEGKAAGFMAWPRNIKSKKPYRGANIFMLIMGGFGNPWFGTKKQIEAMGGKVKKGEAATPIVFFSLFTPKDANGNPETVKLKNGQERELKIPILKEYLVYNIQQTTGLEEKFPNEIMEFDWDSIDAAEEITHDYLLRENIKLSHKGNRAAYHRVMDAIMLPPKKHFKDAEGYYATLLHECGHSTGHEKRLKREFGQKKGDEKYSFEELVAEFCSAFTCAYCGIEKSDEDKNSAEYLRHWASKLNNNKWWAVQAASKAQKAAEFIIGSRPEKFSDPSDGKKQKVSVKKVAKIGKRQTPKQAKPEPKPEKPKSKPKTKKKLEPIGKRKTPKTPAKPKEPPKPKKTKAPEPEPETGHVPASKDDINRSKAERAYHALSHDPEKRGESERESYAQRSNQWYETLLPLANTPEQMEVLETEWQQFKPKFLSMWNAYLEAKSRVMSAFIVGPAKFPTARNEKRQATEDRRYAEMQEFWAKSHRRVEKRLDEMRPPEQVIGEEIERLRKVITENYGVYLGIVNGKIVGDRNLFKSSTYNKLETVAKNGNHKVITAILAELRNLQDKMGVEMFTPRHKIWKLAELAKKSAEAFDEKISRDDEVICSIPGFAEVVNAYSDERVRIILEDRPDAELKARLKSEGWNWSNRNKAWQRKNTPAAVQSAKQIICLKAVEPAPDPAPAPEPEEKPEKIFIRKLTAKEKKYGVERETFDNIPPRPGYKVYEAWGDQGKGLYYIDSTYKEPKDAKPETVTESRVELAWQYVLEMNSNKGGSISNEALTKFVLETSSGTWVNVTGLRRYDSIDELVNRLIEKINQRPEPGGNEPSESAKYEIQGVFAKNATPEQSCKGAIAYWEKNPGHKEVAINAAMLQAWRLRYSTPAGIILVPHDSNMHLVWSMEEADKIDWRKYPNFVLEWTNPAPQTLPRKPFLARVEGEIVYVYVINPIIPPRSPKRFLRYIPEEALERAYDALSKMRPENVVTMYDWSIGNIIDVLDTMPPEKLEDMAGMVLTNPQRIELYEALLNLHRENLDRREKERAKTWQSSHERQQAKLKLEPGTEPWMLTLSQYLNEYERLFNEQLGHIKKYDWKDEGWAINNHKAEVESAIDEGKPVPLEVLSDYPELMSQAHKESGEIRITKTTPLPSPKEVLDESTTAPEDLAKTGEPTGLVFTHVSGKGCKYKHPAGTSDKTYQMQYAITELDNLITSHMPEQGFEPDPRFPAKVQDRDYKKKAEQAKVVEIGTKLQPEYMLSQAVTAAEGTPIVTRSGIVLSGNGRTMGLKYAAEHVPVSFERYRRELSQVADDFGLARTDLEQFRQPVLVRVVDIAPSSKEAIEFGTAANAKIGAARSETREAAHLASIIPPELLLMIKHADDSTLSELLNQKAFRDFFYQAIPVKDRQSYFHDDGRFTDNGKAYVKKIIMIKCLGGPEVIEAMTDAHFRAFESAIPELVEIHQREAKGDISSKYSIANLISEAMLFYRQEVLSKGFDNFKNFNTQQTFAYAKKAKPSPTVKAFLTHLEDFGRSTKQLRDFLKFLYLEADAESHLGSGLLKIEPRTLLDVIETAREKVAGKQRAIKASMFDKRKLGQLDGSQARVDSLDPDLASQLVKRYGPILDAELVARFTRAFSPESIEAGYRAIESAKLAGYGRKRSESNAKARKTTKAPFTPQKRKTGQKTANKRKTTATPHNKPTARRNVSASTASATKSHNKTTSSQAKRRPATPKAATSEASRQKRHEKLSGNDWLNNLPDLAVSNFPKVKLTKAELALLKKLAAHVAEKYKQPIKLARKCLDHLQYVHDKQPANAKEHLIEATACLVALKTLKPDCPVLLKYADLNRATVTS